MTKTPLYELLAVRLGRDPVGDVRSRREAGQTWRSIMAIYERDYGVSVTDVTLRSWLEAAEAEAASA